MNFVQLKYFIAVSELGAVSRAAEYLHISQPSLSLAIKELEGEFGAALFNRVHRGMRLTSEGRELLTMARDIVARVDAAERAMKDMGRDNKTLTLGVPPMIGSLILPEIYSAFLSENSDVSLNIVECGREEMLKKIRESELDMAFVSHGKSLEDDLDGVHASELEMVVCSAKGHRLSDKSALTARDMESVPLVMFKEGFFQTDTIKAWFAAEGIEPNILLKTDQLSTITRLITSGTAAGFLFKGLIENDPDITEYPTSPDIKINVSLVWQSGRFFTAAMRSFKEFAEKNELFGRKA